MTSLLVATTCLAQGFGAPKHAPLYPADFAWGTTLDSWDDSPVHTVLLPLTVYRGVTRRDLGDLRVFNGRDETVPHAIRTLANTPQQSTPFVIRHGWI